MEVAAVLISSGYRGSQTIAGSRFLSQTDFRVGVAGYGAGFERNWRHE